jgi:hypothetical protein
MAWLSFRKVPEICPTCKTTRLVREPRGFFLRLLPKAEKSRCHYCDTIVLRIANFLTLSF